MIRLYSLCALALSVSFSFAAENEHDVSWRAKAEIARRGALVERVAGTGQADDAASAIAAAMQPPADDSHKWHFTLVVTRNCQWCERTRRDFETDERLKAWVDTRDYTKSWAHWQVVQIEDGSQAWRWKDFRPTAFPALIVQPPANGSWGDAHTIIFARQGYLAPADLDAALRQAIQTYAAKAFPRHLAWSSRGGQEQKPAEQAGYNPPAPPPAPLPPVPSNPAPAYPNIPPAQPATDASAVLLLAKLLAALLGGPMLANVLLLAILAWQIYRGIAKREGIPLLLDNETAAQLTDFIRALGQTKTDSPPQMAKKQ
jgi:hypothetical protein